MSENMIACNLTFEEINRLADKVENGKLSKIKIKNGDCEVTIEKETKVLKQAAPAEFCMGTGVMPAGQTASAPEAAPAGTETVPSAAEPEKISGNVVKAPIVGTYYSKPGPDKETFVEVGKTVKKGDVLMIIESMKLMNEVQSEFDGVVKEILVTDGTAVEYDQPIMIIG